MPKGPKGQKRLFLLGAMSWAQAWYQPSGDSPRIIARHLIAVIRGLEEVRHERRADA